MNVPDDTVQSFVEVFADSHTADEVAPALTCLEVEALAEVFRAFGALDTSERWIEAHATADEPGDMHHTDPTPSEGNTS